MAAVNKIDSDVTSLSYAEELTLGTLPGTPDWVQLEPNSYNDFGGEITTLERNPINPSRQRQKGVVTDLDASGGFNHDMTQTNFQDILQGFFFADLRPKGEEEPTGANATGNIYEVALTAGFKVGDLVWASGFADSANNGLKNVSAIVTDVSVAVSQTLVTEASPPAGASITVVGVEGAAGDIDVDASGSLPVLTSTALDFTTLGLVPGEMFFVGGDLAADAFSNAANNGFARIKTIAANALTLDKTTSTMVTEASTTETVQLFFGRVIKNESTSSLIKRRSYNLERQLGAPDDALPAEIQSEYIVGAVASELALQYNTADKVTADLSFVATDHETRTGAIGVKTGNRPSLVSEDAFNTSSDLSRLKLSVLDPVDSNPTALFAFVTEFAVNVNNNISPNKAISVLGAFDVTAGQFVVSGSLEAYFADVAAINSVRNNSDVTLDFAMVKGTTGSKAGVAVDVPLIALGDGRANIEQNEAVKLPITMEAAADRVFDHTLLMVFFDHLPDAADV